MKRLYHPPVPIHADRRTWTPCTGIGRPARLYLVSNPRRRMAPTCPQCWQDVSELLLAIGPTVEPAMERAKTAMVRRFSTAV